MPSHKSNDYKLTAVQYYCLYKLCENKCHKIKRNITRTMDNVPKTEIAKLLIK